jgi:sorting nexin-9/18/33
MAPPPLPPDYSGKQSDAAQNDMMDMGWSMPTQPQTQPNQTASNTDDDWGNTGWGLPGNNTAVNKPVENNFAQAGGNHHSSGFNNDFSASNQPNTAANTNQAYDQDDWDSDFEDEDALAPGGTAHGGSSGMGGSSLLPPKNTAHSGSSGDLNSVGRKSSVAATAVSSKTSFNRFSTFVKSGGENYILGKLNAKVQEADIIQVVDHGDGSYSWLNSKPPYSCSIASPKKESKLKGLKSYIAYQLTPSFNNIQVSRRYKHFDWLHERLTEKFTMIPIPPLPDKQIQGRYEDEFIEHRMNQLQSFVDRICTHPILSQSEVWQHFLTCTDEKRWKTGKRKAEKDPLVGGTMFMTIKAPDKPMDASTIDHEVEVFTRFTTSFEAAVKNMLKTAADQTQKCQNHYKREFQTIGKAFLQLGQAMEQDNNHATSNLTNAVTCTGEAYEEIAKLVDDQPRNDWEHLGDTMHDYRGMLAGWPGILQIHSGSIGKKKEVDRMVGEGKLSQSEATEIGNRTDVLSYGLLAEINTFHTGRNHDIKEAHKHFLREQISHYQKITEKLQDALRMFDNC